jgi:hypothetical protein
MKKFCATIAATVVVVGLATTPADASTATTQGNVTPTNICKWLPSFCR